MVVSALAAFPDMVNDTRGPLASCQHETTSEPVALEDIEPQFFPGPALIIEVPLLAFARWAPNDGLMQGWTGWHVSA